MSHPPIIYLHAWTGDADQARALAEDHFPKSEIRELSHCQLRSGGWKSQLRTLRQLRGEALVVYFERLEEAPQLLLVIWSGLIHHCKQTVVADASGKVQVYRRLDWLRLLPKTLLSAVIDAGVLFCSLILLWLWKMAASPQKFCANAATNAVAYLFPYPLIKPDAGGAVSHIRGVLGGLAANRVGCTIFSGAAIPQNLFPIHQIRAKRKQFLFWETLMLSYSVTFASTVRQLLSGTRPAFCYQRHGRFTVAGALLSQWTGIPLILEYNGSELWMADYWDPTRFRTWVGLCEEVSLKCASLIVVVSDPIRQELLRRGIPSARIIVSPNAVDPDVFRPGCGGERVRQQIGLARDQIVVGFVGSFSHWHGIPTLQKAIETILTSASPTRLRFLLVGKGPLHAEMRHSLKSFEESGQVVFTGIVAHHQVPSYMDAADILLSPHVRLPDGRPFFGSPTKLFEYMAMEKAIVASKLDQLAEVLSHNETALLLTPGSVDELVSAITLLAQDEELRSRLGTRAREVAIDRHTWRQNTAHLLRFVPLDQPADSHASTGNVTRNPIETTTISTL